MSSDRKNSITPLDKAQDARMEQLIRKTNERKAKRDAEADKNRAQKASKSTFTMQDDDTENDAVLHDVESFSLGAPTRTSDVQLRVSVFQSPTATTTASSSSSNGVNDVKELPSVQVVSFPSTSARSNKEMYAFFEKKDAQEAARERLTRVLDYSAFTQDGTKSLIALVSHGQSHSATAQSSTSCKAASHTGFDPEGLLPEIADEAMKILKHDASTADIELEMARALGYCNKGMTWAHVDMERKEEYWRMLWETGMNWSTLGWGKNGGEPVPEAMPRPICFLHYSEDLVTNSKHSRDEYGGTSKWNILINVKALAKLSSMTEEARVEVFAKIFVALNYALVVVATRHDLC